MKILFLDDPRISNVVFYPRKIAIPNNLDPNIKVLKFQIDKNLLIGGFFFLNNPDLPTILLFHGNGEIALDYQYFAPLFFQCGVNLAVVDFRGYGFSSGDPIYSSLISDAIPIYNEMKKWMDDNNLKDSFFVLGRSLGSVCAAEIGAHNPKDLRGIIFESGFGSIYNMMTRLFRVSGPNITPEILKQYSNDTRIEKFKTPVLIIHGTMDWIIPCDEANVIYNALPDEFEKKLIIIEGAGHNDIFSYNEEYFLPLKEFIETFK